jgi:hypothetical protein
VIVSNAGKKITELRHREWAEFQVAWRFRADSLEGGERYAYADYTLDPIKTAITPVDPFQQWPYTALTNGVDNLSGTPNGPGYGQLSRRNLIPHNSETADRTGSSGYVLRLSRTPVPGLVERAVSRHLSKVFAKEVRRDGPPAVKAWWDDVTGQRTGVSEWVQFDVGPLFLVLGQLDLLFDHPPAEPGAAIETRADLMAAGLDRCTVTAIPPEFVTWWRLDPDGCYAEVVFFDPDGRDDSGPLYWHWTDSKVTAHKPNGEVVPALSRDHPYGCVPMVRAMDRRLPRCRNVGRSRYRLLCDVQRAIYNSQSELVLGDVLQAHPVLQGPDDYVTDDGEMTTGPKSLLPMKKSTSGTGVSYQGFEWLDPPQGAHESVRQRVKDYQDEADSDAALSKPAGMTTQGTVAQSGISKIADQADGNTVLASVAAALEKLEAAAARMAMVVLTDGKATPEALDAIEVTYPRQFDLDTVGDVATAIEVIQLAAQRAGALPQTEAELLKRAVSLSLPGLPPARMAELLEEVDAFAKAAEADLAARREQEAAMAEASLKAMSDPNAAPDPNAPDQPPTPVENAP